MLILGNNKSKIDAIPYNYWHELFLVKNIKLLCTPTLVNTIPTAPNINLILKHLISEMRSRRSWILHKSTICAWWFDCFWYSRWSKERSVVRMYNNVYTVVLHRECPLWLIMKFRLLMSRKGAWKSLFCVGSRAFNA